MKDEMLGNSCSYISRLLKPSTYIWMQSKITEDFSQSNLPKLSQYIEKL